MNDDQDERTTTGPIARRGPDGPAPFPYPGTFPHPGAPSYPGPPSYPGDLRYAPMPRGPHHPGRASSSSGLRIVLAVSATVVVLAMIALVGVLLYARVAPRTAAASDPVAGSTTPTGTDPTATPGGTARTVVVPGPVVTVAPRTSSPSGGYSCGSAAGYSIYVENGNVPCTSAVLVTTQWTGTGTTPANGDGPAGTPYSWTCSSGASAVGVCTSKLGSTFIIDR